MRKGTPVSPGEKRQRGKKISFDFILVMKEKG